MSAFLTFADLALAFALFWHSANSPSRDATLRAMLYAFAFSATCFGAARFLSLFGADRDATQWMVDLGHVALIAFGAMWVARETGRMAKLKGN
jgi:hypothetical protein